MSDESLPMIPPPAKEYPKVLWQGDGFVVPELVREPVVGDYRIIDVGPKATHRFRPEYFQHEDAMGQPVWVKSSWTDALAEKLLAKLTPQLPDEASQTE